MHVGLIAELQGLVGKMPSKLRRPGLGDLAFAVGHYARTRDGRAALRAVFNQYIGSSNRSSLSLLSIPHVKEGAQGCWNTFDVHSCCLGKGVVAWLNTGDAELLDCTDLEDWRKAFANDLQRTRVLALPHHGSDKNSDNKLQALCPDAILVAHAKAGSSKHPGPNVVSLAADRLVRVTNRTESEIGMRFLYP